MSCIFCKIASGEIPCKKIYDDQHVLSFLDINPASKGHCLVITKKHYEKFNDIDPEVLVSLIKAVQLVSKKIEAELGPDGYNIINNNGSSAGQTVAHVHFHIVPRTEGDGIIQPWEPTSPEGSELDELQKRLRIENGN
ncbi:HIT family protein [Candidatus Woesearchaeota archaeon]|nr:HIT family protein [Candidatus Woesearchaeota archaeon]